MTWSPTPGAGAADESAQIASRLQKVGSVEIRDANRPLKSGEEVYKAQCAACHATGAAGAPKFEDAAAWAPRIKTGLEALVHSSLTGTTNEAHVQSVGADAYVAKFEASELASALRKVVRH